VAEIGKVAVFMDVPLQMRPLLRRSLDAGIGGVQHGQVPRAAASPSVALRAPPPPLASQVREATGLFPGPCEARGRRQPFGLVGMSFWRSAADGLTLAPPEPDPPAALPV